MLHFRLGMSTWRRLPWRWFPCSEVLLTSAFVVAGAFSATPAPRQSSSPSSEAPRVTYTRDIAPILFRSCAACHRPGEAGPFSLLTFSDVKKHACQIAEV